MIHFDSVSFGYGKTQLFSDLSLRLAPGQIYGLLGLNGAGKTSLLKLASGALFPRMGKITLFGREPGHRDAAVLADIAFVPEDPWTPAISLERWLEVYAPFRPAFEREKFNVLAAEFGLDRNKSLAKVSYGQRKKFAVAAALSSGARAIFLDEPTNGLDIPSKVQLRRALAESADGNAVVVVSTHQVRDLEAIMDPILILNSGSIVSTISQQALSELATVRVKDLGGIEAIYAEQDAMGWTALVSGEGSPPDLELVFAAAIKNPETLNAALDKAGRSMK
ncbi:MAG: ABC transporter ATP-binding protein [Rectinema sp.]